MLRFTYLGCWAVAILALAIILAIYGSAGIRMWIRTRQLFGAVSSEARGSMSRLLAVSRSGRNLTMIRIYLLYAGLGALAVGLVAREWLGLVVAASPFALIWWMRIRTTTPPAVLLLGTSTQPTLMRQLDVKRRVSPLRVVSLLDVTLPWDSRFASELSLDCFRTENEADWWIVVVSLIRNCPVIAIDAAAETEGVAREGEHILSTSATTKCLFLTPPDGYAPILDRFLPAAHLAKQDLQLFRYEDAPEAIARMVAKIQRSSY